MVTSWLFTILFARNFVFCMILYDLTVSFGVNLIGPVNLVKDTRNTCMQQPLATKSMQLIT